MNKTVAITFVIAGAILICDSFVIVGAKTKYENLLEECITRGHVKIVEDVNGRTTYLWHSDKTEGEDAAPNPS